MMRDQVQLAPFDSPEAALRFAYRHKHGDFPPNIFGRWQPRGGLADGEMLPSGQDAALLAGWVRNVVEGGQPLRCLAEPYRSLIVARYCVDPAQNLAAKMLVLEHVLLGAMGTGLHKRRMVDYLVQRYFGGTILCADGKRRPIRQHQVADWCDVSQPTVARAYAKVRDWLRKKERTAMEILQREMAGKGLVN